MRDRAVLMLCVFMFSTLTFMGGYLYAETAIQADVVATYNDGFTDALCRPSGERIEDGMGNACLTGDE
ncbi:hypothetical protein [Streptomyces sp. NRRL F-2580]|uniref:hypothetical protein n=1 Tax=Streptomyces sp. NRRL F-2580 TaxID=1463841 RepID=UPI00131CA27D|nr:hypothetical protein [Streptomyces sp. NRRL F-2580]